MLRIAVFGLGEAGSLISVDLAATGALVTGYDPAEVVTPAGIRRLRDPKDAVAEVEVILGITAEADAITAISQAIDAMKPGMLYADLSTGSPATKTKLAGIAAAGEIEFVDVALMTIVPGNGLRTPALASGPGAERYVSLFSPLGVPVEAISEIPGDSATRKLLRSVMMKGLASLVVEAMQAGNAAGCSEWLWQNMADQLKASDEKVLSRLITGTGRHALRRLHEMEASQSLLEELGVDPVMTRATVESHKRILEKGVPSVPNNPERKEQ